MACIWDESRKETVTVTKNSDPSEIVDSYLQSTYYKTQEKEASREPQTRTTEHGRECRDVVRYETWRQQWGHYCVRVYAARKTRSFWWYVGVGLIVLGVAAVVVITGGAALGLFAAGGAIVTTAGGLTATGSAILAAGGLATAGGTAIVVNVPGGYDRGALKREYETDAPMTDWEKVGERTEETPWRPC